MLVAHSYFEDQPFCGCDNFTTCDKAELSRVTSISFPNKIWMTMFQPELKHQLNNEVSSRTFITLGVMLQQRMSSIVEDTALRNVLFGGDVREFDFLFLFPLAANK